MDSPSRHRLTRSQTMISRNSTAAQRLIESTPLSSPRRETAKEPESNTEQIALQIANSLASALAQQLKEVNFKATKPSFKFAGKPHENPDVFLRKLEEYFVKRRIEDDEEQLSIVGEQLTGDAKRWFDRFNEITITFVEFKNKFVHKYGSTTAIAEGKRLLYGTEQQEREDAELFIGKKWNLMQRFETTLPASARIDIISKQLKPELSAAVQGRYFDDIEDFIQAVLKAERILLRKTNKPDVTTDQNNRTVTVPRNTNNQPTRRLDADRNQPNIPCRFCQQRHYQSECPDNPYRRSGNGQAEDSRGRRNAYQQ